MNNEEFIRIIKIVVRTASVDGLIKILKKPPGRKLSVAEQERSQWFNSLSEKDRVYLDSIIIEAVDEAIFGLLAVIDGVRAIENSSKKGRLELKYIGEEEEVLNDPQGTFLHDIYNMNK